MDEEKNILVSVSSEGVKGNGFSYFPSISADGRYVIFRSNSNNLVSVDTNSGDDIFVRDLVNDTTTLVSVNSEGIQENASYYSPNISADGRYVSFFSISAEYNGINTEFSSNIFVRDLVNGTTTSFPVSSSSMGHTMSADGRYIAYETLKPGSNISEEIFIRDLVTGTTELVSISSEGVKGNGSSFSPSMSADGRYVAFESNADNLVNGDTNNTTDVFVRDLVSGTTTRVPILSNPADFDAQLSKFPTISADGRYVAFHSYGDIFVRDLQRLGATGGVSGGDTGGNTGGDTGGVPGGDT